MFSGKQMTGLRGRGKLNAVLLLPLIIAIILALTGCSATKGSIVILEHTDGTGCRMNFNDWSNENKCELQLRKGDQLLVEIAQVSGDISLAICGKNGSKVYSGSDLESCSFSVTILQTDTYAIQISGKNATGSLSVN